MLRRRYTIALCTVEITVNMEDGCGSTTYQRNMESTFRSEPEFIAWLRRRTTGLPQRVPLGIGDDAALVRPAPRHELILTTDLSIEGIHFDPRLHPPRAIGHRALARSLSDVAAMGGTPRYVMVSLALSKSATRDWIDSFYRGLLTLARRYRVALIGGDTAVTEALIAVDVIVVGEVQRRRALRRSGARPGDKVFVSGCLGLAAWGLELLRSRKRRLSRQEAAALRAHLYPEPQCALGRSLQRLASSMMDLSDGLSLDLRRLCDASRVGARVFNDLIPCPPLAPAKATGLALHGGEDYQLLFTVPRRKAAVIPCRLGGARITYIGDIRSRRGIQLVASDGSESPLSPLGYDHFTKW